LLALNAGVEVRYPFLDERIVKNSFKIDDAVVFHEGDLEINKLFLINLFPSLSAPKSPKQVVQTNQTDWAMRNRDWMIDGLNDPHFDDLGIVDRKKAIQYIEKFGLSEVGVGYPLWQIMNFIVANSN